VNDRYLLGVRVCAYRTDMNDSSPSRTVAANARAEIARLGRTVQPIAEQIGQNRVTLGRRLSGQLPFTIDEIVALSRVLGVPLATLLDGVEETESKVPA